MSFARAFYDSCAFDERVNENASQLDYTMDIVKFENCTPCRAELGLVGGNDVSSATASAIVDIESSLLGIDRPVTRCAGYKHQHPDLRHGGDGTGHDDFIQGTGMYKRTCFPRVPVHPYHLPTCGDFTDERAVPMPEPSKPFECCSYDPAS